jgi:hypothetical protein
MALFVSIPRCADGDGITGPPPDVAGSWLLVRTLVSAQGCGVLLDPSPFEVTFHTTDSFLELEIPSPIDPELTMVGSIEQDGDFQLSSELELPGFSIETTTVQGRFAADALTAIQTSEVVYLDPEFIEIFGIERCESTIRWEGERA